MGTATRFKADNGLDNGNNSITNLGVSGASLTRAGAHALTLTTGGATTATLPSGTVTLVDLSAAQTLSNKSLSFTSNTVTFTSAEARTACSDETGTGLLVFNNAPTLLAPVLSGGSGTTAGALGYTATNGGEVIYGDGSAQRTLVSTNGTQTLTNKTLTTPAIGVNGFTIAGTSGTITVQATATASGTLVLPATGTSDTVVARSTTDTLSNKTIALGSNTVSGTKANFDTACTDDNFAYVGTANAFTAAQTITSTTANQLVVRYDASNAVNFAVSTAGLLTVSPKTGNMIVTGTNSGGWVLGEWTQASGTAGYAMMGHRGLSHTGYGNYAIYQTVVGQTAINAASGQELQLCNNNTVIAVAKSTGFSAKLIPAVNSTVTTNTITPNADVDNMLSATGLTAGITIANHTGTPQNGQKLMVRLKDNGTARSISFGTAYVAGGVALPTTTTANKMTHLGFIYDTGASKWMLIASVTEA